MEGNLAPQELPFSSSWQTFHPMISVELLKRRMSESALKFRIVTVSPADLENVF